MTQVSQKADELKRRHSPSGTRSIEVGRFEGPESVGGLKKQQPRGCM